MQRKASATVHPAMHSPATSLLTQLDESIALMSQVRTPDPVCTAAYDALKQARALVARAFAGEPAAQAPMTDSERVAA